MLDPSKIRISVLFTRCERRERYEIQHVPLQGPSPRSPIVPSAISLGKIDGLDGGGHPPPITKKVRGGNGPFHYGVVRLVDQQDFLFCGISLDVGALAGGVIHVSVACLEVRVL